MAEDLKVRIGADVSGLTKAFKLVKTNALALSASFAGVAVAGLAVMIKKSIDLQDEMGKTAQKLGVTTEYLSTMKYAADLSNVSFEELQMSLRNLSRLTNDASNGMSGAKNAFRSIGVEFKNQNGTLRSTEQLLGDIADKFKDMPDGTRKTALALELFGRAGTQMIPFLNEGSAGLSKLREEARKLGLEIGGKAARDAEKFNDALTTFKGAISGAALQLATALLPSLISLTEKIKTLVTNGMIQKLGKMLNTLFGGDARANELVMAKKHLSDLRQELERLMGIKERGSAWEAFSKEGGTERLNENIISVKQQIEDFIPVLDKMKTKMETKVKIQPEKAEMDQWSKDMQNFFSQAGDRAKSFAQSFADTLKGAVSDIAIAFLDGGQSVRQALHSLFGNLLKMTIDFAITQLGIFQMLAAGIAAALLDPFAAPFVIAGIVVAIAGLAAAYIGTADESFAAGSDYIPQDMKANIHEGERIVPQKTNKDLSTFLENQDKTKNNGKGNDLSVVFNSNISTGTQREMRKGAKKMRDEFIRYGLVSNRMATA